MTKLWKQVLLLAVLLMGVSSQKAAGNLQYFPSSYFKEDTSLYIPHSSRLEQHHVERRAAPYENKLWPYGRIPYKILDKSKSIDGFDATDKQLILSAIEEINAAIPCLNFVDRVGDEYYVHIVNEKNTGCGGRIGYRNDGIDQYQLLRLEADVCLKSNANPAGFIGTALHELMHLAGFYHEHTRRDRDNHVIINDGEMGRPNNILSSPPIRANFDIRSTPNLQLPYDFNSLLHYRATYFSKNGLPTIEAKGGQTITDQRNGMTPLDELGLKLLYKCGDDSYPKVEGCKDHDDHDLCVHWASKGGCTDFTKYMEAACKKTCNMCQGGSIPCIDNNPSCSEWASTGECNNYPSYMDTNCKKSCNKCPSVNNGSSETCELWCRRPDITYYCCDSGHTTP